MKYQKNGKYNKVVIVMKKIKCFLFAIFNCLKSIFIKSKHQPRLDGYYELMNLKDFILQEVEGSDKE